MPEQVLSGRYRIVRHLARGGMAEVYLGHDELLGRTVAIKVLFPELSRDDSFVERFRREARSAAGLNHHNVVSVYDFGEDDGSYFIVMEYVEGETVRDIIRSGGPMDPAEALQIAAEVAAALAAAHAQGIVHRDVKPANVLLSGPTVKVADFGIARAANAREGLTMPGTVIGTATYLSPEQARGAEVDGRSDIYSLGMVLYEMLVGKPPFSGDTPVAVAYKQLHETPPPPSARNPRVPPVVDAIVLKAMSKDPAGRYASADDMRTALLGASPAAGDPDATAALVAAAPATEVLAQGSSTTVLPPVGPPSGPRAAGRPGPPPAEVDRRRRAAVIALVALVVIGLIVAVAVLNKGGKSKNATVVPNVVGQSVADATATLQRAGLSASVTEQDRAGPAGQVADQNPKADATVDRSSTVELIVPRAATTTSRPVATSAPTTQAATTTTPAPTSTQAPSTTVRPTTTVPATTTVAPTTTAKP